MYIYKSLYRYSSILASGLFTRFNSLLNNKSSDEYQQTLVNSVEEDNASLASTKTGMAEQKSSNVIELRQFSKKRDKKNNHRILIADDAKVNRTLLSRALTNEGFIVDEAEDGDQVLDMMESNDYDLLILDDNMPNLSGIETMKTVYALHAMQAKNKKTPIFICSADATQESIDSSLNEGATGYLTKPVQPEAIRLKIVPALQNQGQAHSAEIIDYKKASITSTEKPAIEHLDMERLDGLLSLFGSADAVTKLIGDFLVDTDKNFLSLSQHVKEKELIAIGEAGHSMAGCSSNVGAYRLAEVCKELAMINPSDDDKQIDKVFDEAKFILGETKTAYLSYISHLNQMSNKT